MIAVTQFAGRVGPQDCIETKSYAGIAKTCFRYSLLKQRFGSDSTSAVNESY